MANAEVEELSIIDKVSQLFGEKIGQAPKQIFDTSPVIMYVKDKDHQLQRMGVNRYFSALLYRARAYRDDIDISVVLPILTDTGDYNLWCDLIVDVVFKYLIDAKIYQGEENVHI